jgi:hypothetical protein
MSLLVRVDPRYPGIWEDLKGYLQDAIERGDGERDWGIEDMRSRAETGAVELWALLEADEVIGALVTCRTHYPRRTVLEILAFGCRPHSEESWSDGLLQLQSIAQSFGVQSIVGTGRPGWVKKLPISRRRYVWELDLSE